MIDDIELMRLHVDALFTRDANGRLRCVNEPGDKPAPRMFLGRTTDGHVLRTRFDVSDALRAEAAALIEAEPARAPLSQQPHCGEALQALLARHAPVQRVWSGPAYCIDASVLAEPPNAVRITAANEHLMAAFPDWRAEVAFRQPFFVVVEAERAVALCCSVRITAEAHEAGVETLPESRGRGHASQAVAAWARAVATVGALPLYSTSTDNGASQGVARRLGMRRFGVDFHVS
jgi:RimJ/RimL family protein N-acetyltransferase